MLSSRFLSVPMLLYTGRPMMNCSPFFVESRGKLNRAVAEEVSVRGKKYSYLAGFFFVNESILARKLCDTSLCYF